MKNTTISPGREHITISLPKDVLQQLRLSVEPRKMSAYITAIIQDKLRSEREELKQAYLASNNDPETQALAADWSVCDMDGLDDEEW